MNTNNLEILHTRVDVPGPGVHLQLHGHIKAGTHNSFIPSKGTYSQLQTTVEPIHGSLI